MLDVLVSLSNSEFEFHLSPKEDSQCRLKKKVGECEFPRRHSCVVELVCSSSLFAKLLTI